MQYELHQIKDKIQMFIFRQDKQDYQDKNPIYRVNPLKKEKTAIHKLVN